MEQAFSLPRSALVRPAILMLAAVILGFLLAHLLRPYQSLFALVSSASFPMLLVAIGGWYSARYKYVRVSEAGIRGRAGASFKVNAISWGEQLTVKPTSLPGLIGHTFTSSARGVSIFVPLPILQSLEFVAAVAQHAPENHVLRTTEF